MSWHISLVDIAAGDVIISCILMGDEIPLISIIVVIHVMLLSKILLQLLLHLLKDSAFAKLQQ